MSEGDPAYLKKYEELWRSQPRRNPIDGSWMRAPNIRAADLVNELLRLGRLTGHVAFFSARWALHDLKIINGKMTFAEDRTVKQVSYARWAPHYEAEFERRMVSQVFALKESGGARSLREAYAAVAAEWGIKASSFDAAIKQVERLCKQYPTERAARKV
jgi:hypothetical protein